LKFAPVERPRSLPQPELLQNFVMRNSFAERKGSARAVNSRGCRVCDLFLFHGGRGQRARQRLDHYLEQAVYSIQLFGSKHIEKRMRFLKLAIKIRVHVSDSDYMPNVDALPERNRIARTGLQPSAIKDVILSCGA
jgi:hypothetical protein